MKLVTVLLFLLLSGAIQAGERITITTRSGMSTDVFWHPTPNALATVFILPGGDGGFGVVQNGLPSSRNFLVRTAPYWINDEGFNYMVFGNPSDRPALDYPDRVTTDHLTDLKETLAWLKTKTTTPIWIVGTSRGTVSAALALINIKDSQIAGGVFSSSITSLSKVGALPGQDLARISVPVLVVHHEADACNVTRPQEVPLIFNALRNSPARKLLMMSGGSGASGNPCRALHTHGYVGIEQNTVHSIATWIRTTGSLGR
jgi:hypothetical protein